MAERAKFEKRIGTLVAGKWRIDDVLGWGAISATYAATHRNGHRAALKILHQALCADETVCARFLREAYVVNAIPHRAVAQVRDDGKTQEGSAYLVYDLYDGETLEERRERVGGVLSIEELAPIAEEVMSALSTVHAAGVVHRDIKPGHVLICDSNELKILDFGTARLFDPEAGKPISVEGMVLGTPAFMAPEQARGERDQIDARTDIWSLGATLFTCLSGQPVHRGEIQTQLLAAASKHARSLGEAAPDVHPRIVAIVDRALAFAKADRFADVRQMRREFRVAAMAAAPTMPTIRAFAPLESRDSLAPPPVDEAPNGVLGPLQTPSAAIVPVVDSSVNITSVDGTGRVSSFGTAKRPTDRKMLPFALAGIVVIGGVALVGSWAAGSFDAPSERPKSGVASANEAPDAAVVPTSAETPGLAPASPRSDAAAGAKRVVRPASDVAPRR